MGWNLNAGKTAEEKQAQKEAHRARLAEEGRKIDEKNARIWAELAARTPEQVKADQEAAERAAVGADFGQGMDYGW